MNLRRLLLSLALLAGLAAPAAAQYEDSADSGDAMGLGVGAQALLTHSEVPAVAAVTYDVGAFHIDGLAGLSTLDPTSILAGGRFYYALHRKASSDLSIGGGVGVEYRDTNQGGVDEDVTIYHVEAGAKIRAFIVPNVALTAGVGLGYVTGGADDGLVLTGQFIGTFGVTYFLD